MMIPISKVEFFAEGLDHPECVLVGSDGAIYAGGEAGQIYRIDPLTRQAKQYASTGGYCLGLAEDRTGCLLVCDCKRRAIVSVRPDGHIETIAGEFAGKPFKTPNFGVFDRSGRFYFSDSGDWAAANGVVYRLTPNGAVEVFHEGPFHFANGLALSALEDYLYIAESTRHRVIRIPILKDGCAGAIEVFATGLDRVPDGLAFDIAGNLYVTCYASDSLFRCSALGVVEMVTRDEDGFVLNRPTNCAFYGDALLVANLGGEHIAKLDPGIAGQPLFHQPSQGGP